LVTGYFYRDKGKKNKLKMKRGKELTVNALFYCYSGINRLGLVTSTHCYGGLVRPFSGEKDGTG